jgi:hypothetical protein
MEAGVFVSRFAFRIARDLDGTFAIVNPLASETRTSKKRKIREPHVGRGSRSLNTVSEIPNRSPAPTARVEKIPFSEIGLRMRNSKRFPETESSGTNLEHYGNNLSHYQ